MSPPLQAENRIHAEPLKTFATSVLERAGVAGSQARDAADVLVWASLRGVDTHGIRNLRRYYVDGITSGDINASGDFAIEFETPISMRANGGRGLGLAAACWGMRQAIRKATGSGVGLVSMRNSNHLGAAGYYAYQAVRHDMLGICMSGYLYARGNDTGMPPVFSLQPMFGTNPLSFAFPCDEQPPLVLDMATSVVPVNRVEMMQAAGQTIPEGWALDAEGNPTTDPAQAKLFLPLGGTREHGAHKGFGLATVVEVFTSLLSEAWHETVPDTENATADVRVNEFEQDAIAHFFAAVRLDLFRTPAGFRKGMDGMIRAIQAAAPAPGCERVYVAGGIEHETERTRRRDGIPLPATVLADLQALEETYRVPLKLVRGQT